MFRPSIIGVEIFHQITYIYIYMYYSTREVSTHTAIYKNY